MLGLAGHWGGGQRGRWPAHLAQGGAERLPREHNWAGPAGIVGLGQTEGKEEGELAIPAASPEQAKIRCSRVLGAT